MFVGIGCGAIVAALFQVRLLCLIPVVPAVPALGLRLRLELQLLLLCAY